MFFRLMVLSALVFSLAACAKEGNPYLYKQVDTAEVQAYQSTVNHSNNYVYRADRSILIQPKRK